MTEPIRRPSLREAARRGVEAKRQAQVAPTTPPAAPAAVQSVKRIEQVAAKCGHAVPFELHPDGKDKWRESRRKHVTDRDCPACRQQAHEERARAEQEAARQRRAAAPKPPAVVRDRLPDGARFDVAFDAAAEKWSGTLAVPGSAPFTASASAVFQLLRLLDDLYRDATAKCERPPERPAS